MPESKPTDSSLEGGLALLLPYCGHCHADNSRNPPGFLAGELPRAGVLQCAARILTRLKAWRKGSDFPRSPMPPPASIAYTGSSVIDWPSSDHYRALIDSLENLVVSQHGRQRLGEWRDSNYNQLPSCLGTASE